MVEHFQKLYTKQLTKNKAREITTQDDERSTKGKEAKSRNLDVVAKLNF